MSAETGVPGTKGGMSLKKAAVIGGIAIAAIILADTIAMVVPALDYRRVSAGIAGVLPVGGGGEV